MMEEGGKEGWVGEKATGTILHSTGLIFFNASWRPRGGTPPELESAAAE